MYKVESIIYIAAPRTASTSVSTMICESMGGEKVGPHHSTPSDKKAYKPAKDEVCFTVVRNHWDALVSWYYRAGGDESFEDFIKRFVEKSKYVAGSRKGNLKLFDKYMKHCKHTLRFEQLQKEWDWLCRRYCLPLTAIPHLNESEEREKQPWQELYTPELVREVWEMFEIEIHKLQYYPSGFFGCA